MGKPRKGVRKVVHRSGKVTWQDRWYTPDGVRRSKNFSTAGEAEAHKDAVEAARRRGEYQTVVPAESKTTFAECAQRVESRRRDRRSSTKSRDDSVLRNLVMPYLGDRLISTITPDDVEAWIDALIEKEYRPGRHYAPDTIRRAKWMVARTFDAAVEHGDLSRSPMPKVVRLPQSVPHEPRFLDFDGIWALADAIDPRYRLMVLLGGFGGLRFEEAAGLTRKHLDLSGPKPRLRVVKTLKRDGTLGSPKTAAARRSVTLPRFLLPELANHLRAYPPSDDGLLFNNPEGGAISYTNWRRRFWLPAVLSTFNEVSGYHALRHSNASLLASSRSVHPIEVQARLGHKDVRITLQVYSHLFEGADQAAADALDALQAAHGDAKGMQNPGQVVVPLRPAR
jgi:integrase